MHGRRNPPSSRPAKPQPSGRTVTSGKQIIVFLSHRRDGSSLDTGQGPFFPSPIPELRMCPSLLTSFFAMTGGPLAKSVIRSFFFPASAKNLFFPEPGQGEARNIFPFSVHLPGPGPWWCLPPPAGSILGFFFSSVEENRPQRIPAGSFPPSEKGSGSSGPRTVPGGVKLRRFPRD